MHLRISMLAALIALMAASSAFAQSLSADEAVILVTASRFPDADSKRSIGATVITAAEISKSTATTLAEVLNKLGGVHVRQNLYGTPDLPIDLRGFGVTGDQNTLVLLNGNRISEGELVSAQLSAIPLQAIERIEILRGAGAVLYGSGATAGAINIVTKSPIDMPASAEISGLLGSYGTSEVRLSGRAGSDKLGFNVFASHRDTDNYRQNNAARTDAASGELRMGGDADYLAFRFGGSKQNTRLPGPRTEAQYRNDPRGTSTPNDYARQDAWNLGVSGQRRMDAWTLAGDVSYREKSSRSYFDYGFGMFTLSDVDVATLSFSPRAKWDNKLAGRPNQLVFGFDWADWDYGNRSVSDFGFGNLPTEERGKQRNSAIYLRDDLQILEGTRLTIGGRLERVEQSTREDVTPIPRQSRSDTLASHELALRHTLSDTWSIFGRLGRSFRVANIDENRFRNTAELLKPQTSLDREIGVERRVGKEILRAAAFDLKLNNELYYNNLIFSNQNLAPTRRQGLELEYGTRLLAGVDLGVKYFYTRARFREGNYGGVDVAGNDVPLVPRHRASLIAGWQIDSRTRLVSTLTYVGEQRYDNDQANRFRKMPEYALVDLKLNHDVGDWKLGGGVNNVFDKKYYSYAITNGSYTSFNAYPDPRRNFYLAAEYRF